MRRQSAPANALRCARGHGERERQADTAQGETSPTALHCTHLERLPVGRAREVERRGHDALHEGDVLQPQPLRLLLAGVHAHYVLRHQVKRELHSSSSGHGG